MNIQEQIKNMNGKKCGNYYIVTCPNCGRREAYIYIDDIQKHAENPKHKIPVRCNRLNHCGVTSYLEDVEITSIPELGEPDYVSDTAVEKTSTLAKYAMNLDYTFDWRGISNKTLKEHNVIFFSQGWTKWMNFCGKDSFPKRFYEKDHSSRNLFFPCLNYDEKVEYILLRSYDKDVFPKELSINMKRKENYSAPQIWNKKAILEKNKHLYITEGAVDALSLLEINPSISVIGLPGVKKWKAMINEIIDKHQENKVLIVCFDNDESGDKEYKRLQDYIKESNIKIKLQRFPLKDCKDINELLNKDRVGLTNLVNDIEAEKILKPHRLLLRQKQDRKMKKWDFHHKGTKKAVN